MAQQHINRLNAQLHDAMHQLAACEREVQQLKENPEVNTIREQMNDLMEQMSEKDQQIAQLQIENPALQVDDLQLQVNQLTKRLQQYETAKRAERVQIDLNAEFTRGRVPDLIKGLPIFNGNSKQLNTWIQSVEKILQLYAHLETSDFYQLWVQKIRNKITGEAGDMLASNGIPTEWSEIKNQLQNLYGDKRELSTLLQKLFSVKQNRNTVLFTGISTHIQMSDEWSSPADLVKFVDKICLEKFTDGLDEPYSSHVGLLQPKTLTQAFQYAIEKTNKMARKTGELDINCKSIYKNNKPPPIPTRSFYPQTQPPQQRFIQFPRTQYPQFTYPPPRFSKPFQQIPYGNQKQPVPFQQNNPYQPKPFQPNPYQSKPFQPNPFKPNPFQQNTFQNNSFQRNGFQTNSFPNKPQPKPTPMDVDQSIRSRQINYMNRNHPNFHVEENNYQDNEQFYYPPDTNQQQNSTNPFYNDFTVQPTPIPASDQPNEETDELNFQTGADPQIIT